MYFRSVIQIYSSSYSYSTPKHQETEAKLDDQRQKEKEKSDENSLGKPMAKKECTLEAEILINLDHGSTPFDTFQTVTGMNELLKLIVTETNRYATQKSRMK